MGVFWSPPRSWEAGANSLRLPTPGGRGRGTLALRNSQEADPGSCFRPALRSPSHPSPQDLASPRPSLRPFLHFQSLPAPSPSSPLSFPLPSSLCGPGPPPPPPLGLPACSALLAPGVSGSLPLFRSPRTLPTTPPCPPRGAPLPLPTSPNSTFPRAAGRPASCVRAPRRTVRGPAAAGGEVGSRGQTQRRKCASRHRQARTPASGRPSPLSCGLALRGPGPGLPRTGLGRPGNAVSWPHYAPLGGREPASRWGS